MAVLALGRFPQNHLSTMRAALVRAIHQALSRDPFLIAPSKEHEQQSERAKHQGEHEPTERAATTIRRGDRHCNQAKHPNDYAKHKHAGVLHFVLSGALILSLTALTGCASQVAIYGAHISEPMRGVGAPPIGDNGRTEETWADSVGVSVRWERGGWFAESGAEYVVESGGMVGGPLLFNARTGWAWDTTRRGR